MNKQSIPKAYKCLIKKHLDKDGFDILAQTIIKGGPQLGRDKRALVDCVKELKIQDCKESTEFFHRAKVMEYEI